MSRRFGRNGRRIAYWIILALIGGVLALVLSGCTKRLQSTETVAEQKEYILDVFTDSTTGCQYLGAYQTEIVPRIAADGRSHLGCKGAKP